MAENNFLLINAEFGFKKIGGQIFAIEKYFEEENKTITIKGRLYGSGIILF